MNDKIVIILLVLFAVIAGISTFYKLYKDFDKLNSSDPLNDDFDEHTDQFII